jgi:putative transposase
MHDGARAEPVLAAWGMTTKGRPVLVGLEPGASESTDAWTGFLEGMVSRGLRAPLLVVSDGAPGLLAGVELVFAHSLHQRCLIHCARNVLAKVPVEHQAEVKVAFWRSFDDIDVPAWERAIAVARGRADEFAKTYAKRFPAAVECLMTNLESRTTYLRFPARPGRLRPASAGKAPRAAMTP